MESECLMLFLKQCQYGARWLIVLLPRICLSNSLMDGTRTSTPHLRSSVLRNMLKLKLAWTTGLMRLLCVPLNISHNYQLLSSLIDVILCIAASFSSITTALDYPYYYEFPRCFHYRKELHTGHMHIGIQAGSWRSRTESRLCICPRIWWRPRAMGNGESPTPLSLNMV